MISKEVYKTLKSLFENHDTRCIRIEYNLEGKESFYLCDLINFISRNIFTGKIRVFYKAKKVVLNPKELKRISGTR
jgi:hypothetical protein